MAVLIVIFIINECQGLLIWNAAVVLMGFSQNFWQLTVSRVILGIGEAFSAPASYSLIADYFPVESRAEVTHYITLLLLRF